MRFFTISLMFALLALSGVGCIQSIEGGTTFAYSPQREYVRFHTIDLRFVLHDKLVEYGKATVTQIPGITYPPTREWQISGGYARLNLPYDCVALDVRVTIGSLEVLPIRVPNKDGTHVLMLASDVKEVMP